MYSVIWKLLFPELIPILFQKCMRTDDNFPLLQFLYNFARTGYAKAKQIEYKKDVRKLVN